MPDLDEAPWAADSFEADIVIVGAGPAGLAAAQVAAKEGASVLVLDAAPSAGGQIWRARQGVAVDVVASALARLAQAGVRVLAGTRVVMPLPDRTLLIDGPQGAQRLRWRRLILATGARERLLPFPGWTLPGVFGAGGLQALVKGGWPIAGRRVVVAGTGPLLLAAAATLRREGARVVGIVDESPRAEMAGFAAVLLRHPSKLVESLRLARRLLGVPWMAGTRIVAAEGTGRVERVVLTAVDRWPTRPPGHDDEPAGAAGPRTDRTIACDLLAAGWGLIPQTELALALGCAAASRFGAQAVVVDACQRTSVDGVFAIGECTGIAGVRAAALQGLAAGAAAANDLAADARRVPASVRASASIDPAAPPVKRLAREFEFAAAVARTFPAPVAYAARLRHDTIVCRCEDVPWSAVRGCPDLRSAKLATRCGMGHCQGRLCHDALATMMGWSRLSARPPLMPVALGAFVAIAADEGAATDPAPDSLPNEETP